MLRLCFSTHTRNRATCCGVSTPRMLSMTVWLSAMLCSTCSRACCTSCWQCMSDCCISSQRLRHASSFSTCAGAICSSSTRRSRSWLPVRMPGPSASIWSSALISPSSPGALMPPGFWRACRASQNAILYCGPVSKRSRISSKWKLIDCWRWRWFCTNCSTRLFTSDVSRSMDWRCRMSDISRTFISMLSCASRSPAGAGGGTPPGFCAR
mmetsp:Transcript_23062/g.67950  ORF Transcript_23062/g.67950 Transcript_23062/m.67950 type:complete len:210 (-) Transcript_23062:868-1497(-)